MCVRKNLENGVLIVSMKRKIIFKENTLKQIKNPKELKRLTRYTKKDLISSCSLICKVNKNKKKREPKK